MSVSADSYCRWIPLVTPAVTKDAREVDYELLVKRVCAAIAVAFSLFVASFSIPAAYSSVIFALRLSSVTVLTASLLDRLRAQRVVSAAEKEAKIAEEGLHTEIVQTYLKGKPISKNGIEYLQNNLKAAQLLVAENQSVKKDLSRLLDGIVNFDVFKCLVDAGVDLKYKSKTRRDDGGHFTLFQQLVNKSDSSFLEYALKQGKVRVEDFNSEEQLGCWLNLGCEKSGSLLLQYGFDINVHTDWNSPRGRTPLMVLARRADVLFSDKEREDLIEKVTLLLKLGADKTLRTPPNYKLSGKTASELTNNEAVRELIDGWGK